MIAISTSSVTARWHRQLGAGHQQHAHVRPLGALGYLANGPVLEGMIEIENLVLVVVYDDPQDSETVALRLAGYSGSRTAWGVQWGGADQSLFFKDLRLCPCPRARGLRVDSARTRLLQLSLQLACELDRHDRQPWMVSEAGLRLPQLWAGFRTSRVSLVSANGPELAACAQRTCRSPEQLLKQSQRAYEGLTLYPLDWVSHCWPDMTAVFADLADFPRRQVFSLQQLPGALQGYQGAAQFDLYHSQYRQGKEEYCIAADAAQSVPA